MKAVQASGFGAASVLSLVDIEKPQPSGRDILVRVKASGLNPIEWRIPSGAMAKAIGRDLPVTFGWAYAGIVESVGADVTAFKAGDEIYSYPEFTRGGTHTEFVLIDEGQAALKPNPLTFAQAAAAAMTAQAAWTSMDVAKIQSGERVLVHGRAGCGPLVDPICPSCRGRGHHDSLRRCWVRAGIWSRPRCRPMPKPPRPRARPVILSLPLQTMKLWPRLVSRSHSAG